MHDEYHTITLDTFELSAHTMGDSLFAYIAPKIHQEIKRRPWSRIIIRGKYDRSASAIPAVTEKSDKPFNFHRPTATIDGGGETLMLNCFPGRDYVRHYAALVAIYLVLSKRDPSVVCYVLPTEEDLMQLLLQSNLKEMGKPDCVIVGYVHHLLHRHPTTVPPSQWEDIHASGLFAWHKKRAGTSEVAMLGVLPSFWGDISAGLVKALQMLNGVKCILYIGKGGSLDPTVSPNEFLATGNESNIILPQQEAPTSLPVRNGISSGLADNIATEMLKVEWENVLAEDIQNVPKVLKGGHVNVYSPLVESKAWLDRWGTNGLWVDCEVGYMAKACLDGKTEFGYIHVVSDNIRQAYRYDLSNEEMAEVKGLRSKLFRTVDEILESFLARWTPPP
jgi:hypothetical protein